jgi:RNA polymerase sigma factor (TIGR02999 family)
MLQDVAEGSDGAMDRLMSAAYDDLEAVAARHMARRFGAGLPGVTLEPAALVNESFLKLLEQRQPFRSRGQFYAIATRVMLRVLGDYQRRRGAARRGGDRQRITMHLDGGAAPEGGEDDRLIELETLVEALDRLETLDARKADVVRLRVVWGLQMPQIAEALDVSPATVERDWAFAKAWLSREAGRARDGAG